MGFGAGTGSGKEDNPGGGGGGLGMKPVAVVIIDQQGVRIERLKESRHSLAEHLVEAMPEFLDSMTRKKETHVEIEGPKEP